MVEVELIKGKQRKGLDSAYDGAIKVLFDKKNVKKALKLCEKGLKEAEKEKDEHWIGKFSDFRNHTIPVELKKKFKLYLDKATKKEKDRKYADAIKTLIKAKELLKALYKLEKKEEILDEHLQKINQKISRLEDKIKEDSNKIDIDDQLNDLENDPQVGEYIPNEQIELESDKIDIDDPLDDLEYNSQVVEEMPIPDLSKEIEDSNKLEAIKEAYREHKKEIRKETKYNGGLMFHPKFKINRPSKSAPSSKSRKKYLKKITVQDIPRGQSVSKNSSKNISKNVATVVSNMAGQIVQEINEEDLNRMANEIINDKTQGFSQEIRELEQEIEDYQQEVNEIRQEIQEEGQSVAESDFQKLTRSTQNKGKHISIQEEVLNHDSVRQLTKKVEENLKSSGYYVIPKNSPLTRRLMNEIDVLALKVVHIGEDLDEIIILPVEVCNLKGSLVISEDKASKFDYRPSKKKLRLPDKAKNILVAPNVDKLARSQKSVFRDLTNEGSLFKFFKRYLKMNISVEKTKTNKRLFFRFGQVQYKILIDPILVCQSETYSREKVVPYPYLKSSNLHAIKLDLLPELVEFLEKKYAMIESYSHQESPINSYFNGVSKFMADVRLYSVPFIAFGFIFLLAFVFQAHSILQVLIALGYAAIGIYSAILLFLYVKFSKRKSELTKEFNTPYYQKPVNVDETDLLMISEEFSNELMEQFIYECFGKDAKFDVVSRIEREKVKKIIPETKSRKNDQFSNFLEEDKVVQKIPAAKSLRDRLIEKYSSFLED